mmetsp:Transcript_34781/g.111120  ORF Transcript_34781/g.111120 Transcript_34781/m.111120 type:complete len:254 (-) Transcript_34781:1191-1952(-)
MYSIASSRLACTAPARSARALCAHTSRKPALKLIRWLRGTTIWVAGSAARPSRLHGATRTSKGLDSPAAAGTSIRTISQLTMKAGRPDGVAGETMSGRRGQSTKTRSPTSSVLTLLRFASRAASGPEGAGPRRGPLTTPPAPNSLYGGREHRGGEAELVGRACRPAVGRRRGSSCPSCAPRGERLADVAPPCSATPFVGCSCDSLPTPCASGACGEQAWLRRSSRLSWAADDNPAPPPGLLPAATATSTAVAE